MLGLGTTLCFLLVANWPASLARLDPNQLLALRAQTHANEHECLLTRSHHSTKMQGCQCLVYYSEEAKAGSIHSPLYPAAYPSNVGCLLFVLFANVSEVVEVEFVQFDLARPSALSRSRTPSQAHAACSPLVGHTCLDKVSIYLSEKDELHDRDQPECELCGSLGELASTRFLSYGRSMFLEFHSQSQSQSNSKLGFMANYRFVRTDQSHQSRELNTHSTTKVTTTTVNVNSATFTSSANLVSESGVRAIRTYDDYNYEDEYNLQASATTTTAAAVTVRVVTPVVRWNYTVPCNRTYQSGHPEGLILSSKRQVQKQSVVWTAANCTRNFAPNLPNTTFFFNGSGAENVQLTFLEIEFESPGHKNADADWSCVGTKTNAYVDVFEGTPSKSSGRRIGRLCRIGSTVNTLRSRCNQIYMVLYNGAQPSDSLLLRFNYRFLPFRRNSPLEYCSKTISSSNWKQGWLATPGYPFGYAYNTTCNYQFEGSKNERIRVVFETLDLSYVEDDPVEPACSNNSDRVVITTKSANNDNLPVALLCSSSESQQFMSASNWLSVKFVATGSLLRSKAKGFNVSYSFVTDYGVNEGAQVGPNCHFIYDSKNKMNGTLSSPNFPGLYPLDTECLYEFRGRSNEQVQIWLPVFDVAGLQQCEEKLTSDYLEIQDYSTLTQHPIIDRWCSRQKVRRHYRSVSSHVILKFKSNLQHAGIGFDGYYEFVSTIQIAQLVSAAGKHQLTPVPLFLLFTIAARHAFTV